MQAKENVISILQNIDFNKEFIVDSIEGEVYTYNEFFSCCYFIAEQLQKDSSSDTIVAVLENGIELLKLYFATILCRKKIVVIDPQKGKKEIQDILLLQKKSVQIIEEDGQNGKAQYIWNRQNQSKEELRYRVIESIKQTDFAAPFLVTYTSGTSGKTKGVIHSLDNLFSTAFALKDKLDLPETGAYLHLMPMSYMAGILNSIIFPFILGYKIVLIPRFSVPVALSFWKVIKQYEISLLWVSPAMLTMIERVDRTTIGEEYCAGNRIHFLVGTAPLSEVTRQQFETRYAVKLQASYGLSETLFVSVETERTMKNKNKENVGEFLDGVEYKILQDGELLLNVPWMYKGYTNENTDEYFDGGYYKTGDLVEYSDALCVVGRKKDLIIRGGLNLSPKLLEDTILETKCVVETAVFGKTGVDGEEKVCCAYVIDDRSSLSTKELEKQIYLKVEEELGKNYRIDCFIQMEQLPRNINGKVDKKRLLES